MFSVGNRVVCVRDVSSLGLVRGERGVVTKLIGELVMFGPRLTAADIVEVTFDGRDDSLTCHADDSSVLEPHGVAITSFMDYLRDSVTPGPIHVFSTFKFEGTRHVGELYQHGNNATLVLKDEANNVYSSAVYVNSKDQHAMSPVASRRDILNIALQCAQKHAYIRQECVDRGHAMIKRAFEALNK